MSNFLVGFNVTRVREDFLRNDLIVVEIVYLRFKDGSDFFFFMRW